MGTLLPETVRTWLLDPADPSLAYRTSLELLGRSPDEPDIKTFQRTIPDSNAVRTILEQMHPDGYWLQKNPRTQRVVGDGVEYGSFGTTHFCLAYLAELGMDRTDPRVNRAAERYLNLQQPDGDWWQHLSCLNGYNVVTFLKLGYIGDPRLQRTVDLLLRSIRFDDGYLCDMHERARRTSRSCIRGSTKVLEAFAALGEPYRDHESCRRLVAYFLDRDGIFKRRSPDEVVNRDLQVMSFPFHWRTSLVQILLSLSRLGYGRDPRLDRAWALLDSRSYDQGRFPLDWTPSQAPWKVGRPGKPNPWLTFYVYLARKYRDEVIPAD